jgi:glycosyltransferase involved in cell wall biosynthesis
MAVTVLTTEADECGAETVEDGVRVQRTMPGWRLRELPTVLGRLAEAGNETIVHIQYPAVAYRRNPMINLLPALLRGRRPSVPVVVTMHDARVTRMRRRARMAPMLAAARAVVHVDAPDRPYLDRWTWLNRPLTVCIPVGATISPILTSAADRQICREELELNGPDPVVAFFGMLYAHKGLEELVEAIGLLRSNGRPVRLLVIGDFDRETPFEAEVTELLREGRAQGWTVWRRGADAMGASRALRAADVAALPFHSGAASNRSSLLSALAHGLPTVTTRGPATPPDFDTQFPVGLVPTRDAAALAEAIAAQLDSNRGADPVFQSTCSAAIPSWSRVAEEHLKVYEYLLHAAAPER